MKKLISIKDSYRFRQAITKGRWASGRVVSIHTINNRGDRNRIGISISKKTGNAVKRNTIKRRIRAAYTQLYKNVNINEKQDMVVIVKNNIDFSQFTYINIYEDMERLMVKLKIIR